MHTNIEAQNNNDIFDDVWLFAYFKGNGEDGLHLAYSYDAYNFKALRKDTSFLSPTVGESRLMRDPYIIIGADKKFHMVWTTGWTEKGIGYASSTDLEQWAEQQYIPVMAYESTTKNTWAPEITWDDKSQQYYIYWASTILEQSYNHRIYYVITKDFKSFSASNLFYDKGFSVIDNTILKDNEKFIMFFKNETDSPVPEKNIRVVTSDRIDGPYSDPSSPITGNYWAEGPSAIKHNGTYIVYFDKYKAGVYGAVRSNDLKNWEDISDKVLFPSGARHGTVFKVDATFAKEFIKRNL